MLREKQRLQQFTIGVSSAQRGAQIVLAGDMHLFSSNKMRISCHAQPLNDWVSRPHCELDD
jgi:hypothetical protein